MILTWNTFSQVRVMLHHVEMVFQVRAMLYHVEMVFQVKVIVHLLTIFENGKIGPLPGIPFLRDVA
jgi:hypothetical protein